MALLYLLRASLYSNFVMSDKINIYIESVCTQLKSDIPTLTKEFITVTETPSCIDPDWGKNFLI